MDYDYIKALPYEMAVEQLIRDQYSLYEELAIQRQRDSKPEEFKAYNDYCERCKKKARELLNLEPTKIIESEENYG